MSQALVDTAFTVLSNVDGLAEGEVAMAGYMFSVTTHVCGGIVGSNGDRDGDSAV